MNRNQTRLVHHHHLFSTAKYVQINFIQLYCRFSLMEGNAADKKKEEESIRPTGGGSIDLQHTIIN